MTLKEIALEILGKYRDSEISAMYEKYCGTIDKDLDDLSAEIDRYTKQIEIANVQNRDAWIPVSERLPEVGQDVLFSVGGVYTAEGCLRDDGNWVQFRWDSIQRKDIVDAWMPFPEPYREVEE